MWKQCQPSHVGGAAGAFARRGAPPTGQSELPTAGVGQALGVIAANTCADFQALHPNRQCGSCVSASTRRSRRIALGRIAAVVIGAWPHGRRDDRNVGHPHGAVDMGSRQRSAQRRLRRVALGQQRHRGLQIVEAGRSRPIRTSWTSMHRENCAPGNGRDADRVPSTSAREDSGARYGIACARRAVAGFGQGRECGRIALDYQHQPANRTRNR